ncbi:MAG: PP2C family protein-serine/threonine phosphatase [Solirubrobacteraceae bacterium]
MAPSASGHPALARARVRLAVAGALACAVLACPSLAGAIAKPGHASSLPSATALSETVVPVHAPVGEHTEKKGCCAAAPSAPASTPADRRRERAAASPPAAPQANRPPAREKAAPLSKSVGAGEGAAPSSTDLAAAGEARSRQGGSGHGSKERRERREQARERREQSRERREQARERREQAGGTGAPHTKEKGRGKTTSGGGAAPPTAASSTPAAVLASVNLPAPPLTTTPAASTPAAASTPPAASGRLRRGESRRRSTRATVPAGARAAAALVRSPSASLNGLASTPERTARAGHARPAKSAPARGGSSPLARTITRIVGVVPTPVRVLIGVLVALALALALRSRLAALRARGLERQRGQLLEDVGLLQAALLPVPPARLGPVGTSVAYRPADGPGAGGDFYDVFALEDGRVAVILGDVSGHGREALPYTALVRFTLRAYLEAGLSPRSAMQTAGAVLERQLGGSFATVVAATYHPRDRLLVYASAGHPPPLVLGSSAIVPVTVCSSPPIGAGMRTGTRQTIVSVPGRSELCFFTDGLVEAKVGSELFGSARLARSLAELGPRAAAAALLERVAEETDARPDDMAACVLSVEGGARAPSIVTEELELDRADAASVRTERFLLACGVDPRQIARVMNSARLKAGRTGTVLLELHLGEGPPQISMRQNNLALLDTSARRVASAS